MWRAADQPLCFMENRVMRTYDLTPLWRNTIGFDRISTLLDAAMRGDEGAPSYPPYNIEKLSEDDYRIVLAVAGFKREDLSITVKDQTLTVSGKLEPKLPQDNAQLLHKGIATRAFERKFSLADHVKVMAADLQDGLLSVELKREIPESSKPRTVPIGGTTNAPLLDQKAS